MMSLDPDKLWAKSKRCDEQERPSMRLLGHLQDVYNAAVRVLDATGDAQLSSLGLKPALYSERFRRCVLLAAAVHDLGKANDHTQDMLRGIRNVQERPQGLRHEWATILIMQSFRSWLLPAIMGSEIDLALVEWAVAGHHPAHHHASPPQGCPDNAGATLTLLTGHPDFIGILNWLAYRFDLADPLPQLENRTLPLTGVGRPFDEIAKWMKAGQRRWDTEVKKSPFRAMVAAIKNCLVAADVAGSALPRVFDSDDKRWDWVTTSFANRPEQHDLEAIAAHRLGSNKPRPFQETVAASDAAVTYVKAGCGTGKTLAAYLWAAKNYPTRRLYFCYPTTGTATEGFKDYLYEPDGELGDIGAKLFHSRRDVDHEIILETGRDSESPEADATAKLESLEAWDTPVVACTVDTVLGIVQNNKRGLFAWPALAQSAFIFDEIHAYDDLLFGALLRFLRDVPGVPSLLMTASLPKPREAALRVILRQYRDLDIQAIPGPTNLEILPRYHKQPLPSGDPMQFIVDEVKHGGKVLWVSNTVQRVMDSATRAATAGVTPLIYHSRFKYEHRVRRHKAVINAFTPERTAGVLACTSQVCEMSLDLKGCTLLVTELATVPALIQRLGRLNRQAKDGDATKPFIVVTPDNPLPYTQADLDAAMKWHSALPETDISQTHLALAWEQADAEPPGPVESAWLDGGPATRVKELRQASPGITVIMRDDIRRAGGKQLAKYTLPMPRPNGQQWRSWPRHSGIPVAESGTIIYDELRGARWNA